MKPAHLVFPRSDDAFYPELRARVRAYLKEPGRSRFAGPAMWRKTATILALIVGLGAVVYAGSLRGLAFVAVFAAWQFTQFLTTIGIAHDATHGVYSRNQKINRRMGLIFDFLGVDSKSWIDTHIDLHHGSPNVPHVDSAIESFSLVRLHPKTERSWISRFQHIYMFGVYALATVFQVYFLEPVAFAQNVMGFRREPGWRLNLVKIIAKKSFVLGYSLILPLLILRNPWSEIVLGWFLGHMLCGLAIGIIFQTTHLHAGTSFIEPNEKGHMPDTFAMHILKTTSEFSTENPVVTWIAGGLNLHVTHHLFPHVSQIHLPALSRIVRTTAREFGMPYTEYTFFGALRSHLRLLKRLGSLPSANVPSRLRSESAGLKVAAVAAISLVTLSGCYRSWSEPNDESAYCMVGTPPVSEISVTITESEAAADARRASDKACTRIDSPVANSGPSMTSDGRAIIQIQEPLARFSTGALPNGTECPWENGCINLIGATSDFPGDAYVRWSRPTSGPIEAGRYDLTSLGAEFCQKIRAKGCGKQKEVIWEANLLCSPVHGTFTVQKAVTSNGINYEVEFPAAANSESEIGVSISGSAKFVRDFEFHYESSECPPSSDGWHPVFW